MATIFQPTRNRVASTVLVHLLGSATGRGSQSCMPLAAAWTLTCHGRRSGHWAFETSADFVPSG